MKKAINKALNNTKENEKIIITVNKQPKQAKVTIVLNLKELMNLQKRKGKKVLQLKKQLNKKSFIKNILQVSEII